MKKNGFTLIELLAVIIILAIVALISTPIILNVVDEARESANKSSVAMYADAVKLAVIDSYFENQSYPAVDENWVTNNVEYGGERIICEEFYYTETEGVTLHECIVSDVSFNYADDIKVLADNTVYCYTKGMVYTDCTDETYKASYDIAVANASSILIGNDDTSGANAPQLLDGMTPIKWNGIIEEETTEDDPDWYNYSNKLWANAKTEDGSYWVWIPRYAYMIGSGYHTSIPNEISIEFLENDTINNANNTIIEISDYEVGVKDTSNNYFLHPAFENEDTKYGFWIAKFEASGSSNNIAIKPGVHSLRGMTVGEQFDAAIAMRNNENYGWNISETETHMMTNYEWGVLAYLKQSKYGLGLVDIEVNTSSSFYTGGGTSDAYKTNIDQSTTGNITGVYDMSGGSYEYTAAYVANSYAVDYGNSIVNSTSNYKNVYMSGSEDNRESHYEANKNIYGDAVYETSSSYIGDTSWNGDGSIMPYYAVCWFERGGYYSDSSSIGIFRFINSYGNEGNPYDYYSFRPVVVKAQF